MATEEELQEAWIGTRVGLLKAIDSLVGDGAVSEENAETALLLAEAFAWVTRADQPHGRGA